MDDEMTPKKVVGCALGLIAFFVSLPMWYILLFSLLRATDAEIWQWVLFWIYVPVSFIIGLCNKVVESLFD